MVPSQQQCSSYTIRVQVSRMALCKLFMHRTALTFRVSLLIYRYFVLSQPVPFQTFSRPSFYRAMHFSAKSGIAIACRLSVRLSVTLVNCDHIGWNSSKIISPLVSMGRSLFATLTWRVCSKGIAPKFGPKVTHPLLI